MTPVDPLSTSSLYVETFFEKQKLGSATGFVVMHDARPFLISSRHVLSGRRVDNDEAVSKTGGIPDRIEVHHHHGTGFGHWKPLSYNLADSSGATNWFTPPGDTVDVAALPLGDLPEEFSVHPLDMSLAHTDVVLRPGMELFIIGFPLGLKNLESLPIWKTGHIASDPNTNYNNTPCLLIDATTRDGMSGSPVIARLYGGYSKGDGSVISIYSGPVTKFIGVYSGRLRDESEIGIVWKHHVLDTLLNAGIRVRQELRTTF